MNIDPKMFEGRWDYTPEHRYFFYDPEDSGFVYFKTEEQRDAFGNSCIQQYNEDGWDEECVMQVIAGEVTHRPTKLDVIPRPPDEDIDEEGMDQNGVYWPSEWDWICDYRLKPNDGTSEGV